MNIYNKEQLINKNYISATSRGFFMGKIKKMQYVFNGFADVCIKILNKLKK